MPDSVIEAIRQGIWDFEPSEQDTNGFRATAAMPGTDEKLEILAARVQQGLPLWHNKDRDSYDAPLDQYE